MREGAHVLKDIFLLALFLSNTGSFVVLNKRSARINTLL